METIALYILNGLSWGMLLFLISLGLTTVFGVLGVLNFARGSLFMLGAYFSLQIMRMSHNFWLALAFAPIFVAVVGAVIEKFILKRVYVRNVSYQLLITFGILLMLDDAVRLIWGPAYHVIDPPLILSGSITVFGRAYPVYRFFLILVGPVLKIFIWAFFSFTRLGKVITAAAFDRKMAAGIGIDVNKLFTLVFGFGTYLAALKGALAAPHQSVGPAMGERVIIESFIVVVIGGLGSYPGAFVGALVLGIVESFGTAFAGPAQMALPYMLLAFVLLVRPRGLFGKEV